MKLILTCREVADKLAAAEKMGMGPRLKLRFHVAICGSCATFAKHLDIMTARVRLLVDTPDVDPAVSELEKHVLAEQLGSQDGPH